MFYCCLCEKERVITTSLCENCRVIKHLMTCYTPERVQEVCIRVLMRTEDKQALKMNECMNEERKKLDETIKTRSQKKAEKT